jgi:hypothetical protein
MLCMSARRDSWPAARCSRSAPHHEVGASDEAAASAKDVRQVACSAHLVAVSHALLAQHCCANGSRMLRCSALRVTAAGDRAGKSGDRGQRTVHEADVGRVKRSGSTTLWKFSTLHRQRLRKQATACAHASAEALAASCARVPIAEQSRPERGTGGAASNHAGRGHTARTCGTSVTPTRVCSMHAPILRKMLGLTMWSQSITISTSLTGTSAGHRSSG